MYKITHKFISLSETSVCICTFIYLNSYPISPFEGLRDISNLPCPKLIRLFLLNLLHLQVFHLSEWLLCPSSWPAQTFNLGWPPFLYEPQIHDCSSLIAPEYNQFSLVNCHHSGLNHIITVTSYFHCEQPH